MPGVPIAYAGGAHRVISRVISGDMASEDWLSSFPELAKLDADARRKLKDAARAMTLPAGTPVFGMGDACQNYLLVRKGSVRVQRTAENGREIVLYRVEAGETCVLTTNCLMTHSDYGAEAISETEVEAIALSQTAFEDLLARSAAFRSFVFSSYATRISDLLLLIEEVAFGRIDMRLAQFLVDRKNADNRIEGTHQDLATELGTAREVISRQLKDFERRGWVSIGRGRLHVTDALALADLAKRDRKAALR